MSDDIVTLDLDDLMRYARDAYKREGVTFRAGFMREQISKALELLGPARTVKAIDRMLRDEVGTIPPTRPGTANAKKVARVAAEEHARRNDPVLAEMLARQKRREQAFRGLDRVMRETPSGRYE
ncbi:hypothetical protein [Gulosibacter molinativorax]|uniref:Uncharacterized protein n=1 Tax=Gulosibacter molinativorax TaxID=256821 RepID=A0ABT7C662_9MICO|nr:hypothetical protein [Gulosibacter molinativorax]MDJ1370670.1 hypothetical protein [Gulosibacter molinativorax]QUY63303.1 Hypotetical protein [Gulosibacter molinativorax]